MKNNIVLRIINASGVLFMGVVFHAAGALDANGACALLAPPSIYSEQTHEQFSGIYIDEYVVIHGDDREVHKLNRKERFRVELFAAMMGREFFDRLLYGRLNKVNEKYFGYRVVSRHGLVSLVSLLMGEMPAEMLDMDDWSDCQISIAGGRLNMGQQLRALYRHAANPIELVACNTRGVLYKSFADYLLKEKVSMRVQKLRWQEIFMRMGDPDFNWGKLSAKTHRILMALAKGAESKNKDESENIFDIYKAVNCNIRDFYMPRKILGGRSFARLGQYYLDTFGSLAKAKRHYRMLGKGDDDPVQPLQVVYGCTQGGIVVKTFAVNAKGNIQRAEGYPRASEGKEKTRKDPEEKPAETTKEIRTIIHGGGMRYRSFTHVRYRQNDPEKTNEWEAGKSNHLQLMEMLDKLEKTTDPGKLLLEVRKGTKAYMMPTETREGDPRQAALDGDPAGGGVQRIRRALRELHKELYEGTGEPGRSQ